MLLKRSVEAPFFWLPFALRKKLLQKSASHRRLEIQLFFFQNIDRENLSPRTAKQKIKQEGDNRQVLLGSGKSPNNGTRMVIGKVLLVHQACQYRHRFGAMILKKRKIF